MTGRQSLGRPPHLSMHGQGLLQLEEVGRMAALRLLHHNAIGRLKKGEVCMLACRYCQAVP